MDALLVIQTAFVGDMVLTTPLLRALKRRYPEARLTLLSTPAGAALLRGSPYVDETIVFDKKKRDRSTRALVALARRLRAGGFDAVVAAQRSFRTGVLVRATGAPLRIGFAGAPGGWAYTRRVAADAPHQALRYLALAGAAGVDLASADGTPELPVLPEAAVSIDRKLEADGIGPCEPLLVLAPGSVWGSKRWTPEGFAAVAAAAPALGLRPVLVGSPDEAELAARIAAMVSMNVPSLAGRSDLAELAALAARARVLVANDSGSGHIAAAVGTPVVSIFGPTSPSFGFAPYGRATRIVEVDGLDCRPCDRHGPPVCPLGHHRCMREIRPERVIEAVRSLLTGRGLKPQDRP